MKRVRVKICGLTDEAALDAAIDAGADAVGFVFAESPRRISLDRAIELASRIPAFVDLVAVFAHASPSHVAEVAERLRPQLIQAEATKRPAFPYPFLPVYRDTDAELLKDRQPSRKTSILFEGARSGSGDKANWAMASQLARRTRLVLAGGLTPDTVGDAIRQVRPWAVDVSSGVEARRGAKDPVLIRRFLRAVRNTENSL